MGNGAIGVGVNVGAGMGIEGVAVGTLTVGNNSLATGVIVGVALGMRAELIRPVPTPYV